MLKRTKLKKWIIIIAAVVILLFVFVGVFNFKPENLVNIRNQQLNTYRFSSGGGMNGGYHLETVKRCDDQALIILESAEWHSQDPTVEEYLTDPAILDELEEIVRRNHMNFWNGKKFTNEFVYDGESESYHFSFDEANISFSSQIYPLRYRKKLSELDRVVEKYIEIGEKLPGLVNPRTDEDENYDLPENELEIYVYSYAENSLGLRILNGTDEEIEIPESYKLINADTGVVLCEDETPYGGWFSEQTRDEMQIRLQDRLPAGNYLIIFGDTEIPFEIR